MKKDDTFYKIGLEGYMKLSTTDKYKCEPRRRESVKKMEEGFYKPDNYFTCLNASHAE